MADSAAGGPYTFRDYGELLNGFLSQAKNRPRARRAPGKPVGSGRIPSVIPRPNPQLGHFRRTTSSEFIFFHRSCLPPPGMG